MATCSKCKAQIAWVYTEAGKRMPLDTLPVPDGNVVYSGNGADRVRVLKKEDEGDLFLGRLQRYKSHFATCKFASRFRN